MRYATKLSIFRYYILGKILFVEEYVGVAFQGLGLYALIFINGFGLINNDF
jgi:hypothetical protein